VSCERACVKHGHVRLIPRLPPDRRVCTGRKHHLAQPLELLSRQTSLFIQCAQAGAVFLESLRERHLHDGRDAGTNAEAYALEAHTTATHSLRPLLSMDIYPLNELPRTLAFPPGFVTIVNRGVGIGDAEALVAVACLYCWRLCALSCPHGNDANRCGQPVAAASVFLASYAAGAPVAKSKCREPTQLQLASRLWQRSRNPHHRHQPVFLR
jgi:hypothetical protein